MKIFRKKREQSSRENKIGKYAAYAIGEIILLVIGILIALNVNNWNAKNKNIGVADEFINDLIIDLRRDTTNFGEVIRLMNSNIAFKTSGLKTSSFNDIPTMELEYLTIPSYHNIKLNSGTYVRMQKANIWALKDYKDLFKQISIYYTFYKNYLDNYNEWEQSLFDKEFIFWNDQNQFEIQYQSNDSIPILQDTAIRRKNMIELISSTRGRNYLTISLMKEQEMRNMYQAIYDEANALLNEIDDFNKNKQ